MSLFKSVVLSVLIGYVVTVDVVERQIIGHPGGWLEIGTGIVFALCAFILVEIYPRVFRVELWVFRDA